MMITVDGESEAAINALYSSCIERLMARASQGPKDRVETSQIISRVSISNINRAVIAHIADRVATEEARKDATMIDLLISHIDERGARCGRRRKPTLPKSEASGARAMKAWDDAMGPKPDRRAKERPTKASDIVKRYSKPKADARRKKARAA